MTAGSREGPVTGLGDDVAEFVSSVWASVLDVVAADGAPPEEKEIRSLSLTDPPAQRNETSL